MIQKQKGTNDIYGIDAKKRKYVNGVLDSLRETYNYGYIETPVFEDSELFHRGVGETTDMVQKETYDFKDRGDRNLTLRPEGTAGVVRWFIENKLYGNMTDPVKVYYNMKMYRYERPQSGRNREFTQWGFECFGRDHRKICVIDGRTAFTGGINLADEYINCVNRFGHWKDSAIMLKGRAAFCFTLAFLELWNMYRNSDSDYNAFRPDLGGSASAVSENSAAPADSKTCAFVQPYVDSPLDDELTGEQVFLNIINQSAEYLYITTPYLIIDNELSTALCLAAKRNVDVRIITPFIPDKWLVHEMTRSYYYELVAGGVRIYEYTPGFMHAKNMVSDDLTATVGTFNMDYRSLYHHFECGVWLYNSSVIKDIKADFLNTLDVCREITPEYLSQTNVAKRLVRSLFKIFAPLL